MTESLKDLEELKSVRSTLSAQLGEFEAEYLSLMREWFCGRLSKLQLDENVRTILTPQSIHLHNLFVLKLICFCRRVCKTVVGKLTCPPQLKSDEAKLQDATPKIKDRKRKLETLESAAELNQMVSPNLIENKLSWRQEEIDRIQVFSDKNEIKNPKIDIDPAVKQTEGIVGRVYISLWEHGLDTVTHDCVVIILKASLDLLRRFIKALLDINQSAKMENPFLSSLSNDSILNKGSTNQLHLLKEMRSNEREFSSEISSDASVPKQPISIRNLRSILKIKPDLLPSNSFRNSVLEKCISFQ